MEESDHSSEFPAQSAACSVIKPENMGKSELWSSPKFCTWSDETHRWSLSTSCVCWIYVLQPCRPISCLQCCRPILLVVPRDGAGSDRWSQAPPDILKSQNLTENCSDIEYKTCQICYNLSKMLRYFRQASQTSAASQSNTSSDGPVRLSSDKVRLK